MAELRFDHILVATDLSPASCAAYGHAVAFARAFDASVTVLYADESDGGDRADPDHGMDLPAFVAARIAAARAQDEGLAVVVANFSALGVDVTVKRAAGNAERAILEHSETAKCDLVIIAKHGIRESQIGVMGTTAERVMHHADVPVIIGYEADPLCGIVANYERFSVSTDYSEDSRLGIQRVLALGERFNAQVDVLHAITVPHEVSPLWRSDYEAAQLEHLNERLGEEIGDPRAHGRVHAGLRVPETVIDGALAAKSDLLCVPTHGKGALRRALFGSIADRVLRLAPLPTMILPRKWLRS